MITLNVLTCFIHNFTDFEEEIYTHVWNKSINVILKLSFKSSKHFISMGFCWVMSSILVIWGIGPKIERNQTFQSWWKQNPSDFNGLPFTLVNTPFSYMVFQAALFTEWYSYGKKSLSFLPWIFFTEQEEEWDGTMSVSLWQEFLYNPQSFIAIIKGEVEACGFSSTCPLHYSRLAYCLKDVALSKDTDDKIHWLQTNRSLSTSEGLAHWCLGFLY